MINSRELIDSAEIEINIPFKNLDLQFITCKNWEGQAIKMPISLFKELLDSYLRILITDELRRDKKIVKKIININVQMEKHTDHGIVYILLEKPDGGIAKVGQLPKISVMGLDTFNEEGWAKFSEILLLSMKNQLFTLSLRTTIEAKILNSSLEKKTFKIIHDEKVTEEKIKLANFQFRDLNVLNYYKNLKNVLKCYGIKLLE